MKTSLDSRSESFLNDLGRLDEREARIQRSMSSGYRVNQSSDAPGDVIDILQLRSSVSRGVAIDTNLTRVSAEVNAAESATDLSIRLLERARTLAAQGASDTTTDRKALATEIRELHQQLVDITKTTSEGRFVFSGDLDQSSLYEADWTQPGGISKLADATNTRAIEDVNGTRFNVARTASDIFDTRESDGSFSQNNTFNALWTLGQALESDDRNAVEDAGQKLTAALDHVNRQLTFYGQMQNRVSDAQTLAKSSLVDRRAELSNIEDTDSATAIVELTSVQVHRQAALGAQSQRSWSSLFDYLG